MKKVHVAMLAVAGLLLTPTVASAQFCAVGLVAKAVITSITQKRELTEKEAMWCGLYTEDVKPAKKKKMAKKPG